MAPDSAKQSGSFIVRIWWERSVEDVAGGHWRGWIQHVRNGHQIYFADLRDLATFIEGETGIQPGADSYMQGLT